MLDLRTAALMALDALTFCGDPEGAFDKEEAAADALRAALDQPDPEPVAWMCLDDPERETAFTWKNGRCKNCGKNRIPLYTAPPKRPWQGLTDEEIAEAMVFNKRVMCAHIEAKLKEKNT